MPTLLNVAFSEKDIVKQLGAWWSPEKKLWIAPDHIADLNRFRKWIPYEDGFIVRERFTIVSTKRICWKCNHLTPVTSLGAKNFYELQFMNEDDELPTWIKNEYPCLFTHISRLEEHVVKIMQEINPQFKKIYSNTMMEWLWANSCQRCNALQGDFFLHQEPDEAFLPTTPEALNAILVHHIPLDFDSHLISDLADTNDEWFM